MKTDDVMDAFDVVYREAARQWQGRCGFECQTVEELAAGFAYSGDLHEGCLARRAETIEMRLNAFGKRTRSLLASSTKFHDVPSACLYD